MTLKQEIEATIQAYEEACKLENLNFRYCVYNNLNSGLCTYAEVNDYKQLFKLLSKNINGFLCTTPNKLNDFLNRLTYCIYKTKCETILDCHQIRLNYLRNLLNTLSHENN